MWSPRKPTPHEVMWCIFEQSRSNGNTTLQGIRARLGYVHGWHTEPTYKQVREVVNVLLSRDLAVRDGFAQGEHYALTYKGREQLEEVMRRRETGNSAPGGLEDNG